MIQFRVSGWEPTANRSRRRCILRRLVVQQQRRSSPRKSCKARLALCPRHLRSSDCRRPLLTGEWCNRIKRNSPVCNATRAVACLKTTVYHVNRKAMRLSLIKNLTWAILSLNLPWFITDCFDHVERATFRVTLRLIFPAIKKMTHNLYLAWQYFAIYTRNNYRQPRGLRLRDCVTFHVGDGNDHNGSIKVSDRISMLFYSAHHRASTAPRFGSRRGPTSVSKNWLIYKSARFLPCL